MIGNIGKKGYLRIKKKINMMGGIISPKIFIYMRLISCLIIFILLLFLSKYSYLIAPLVTIGYYFLLEYLVLDCDIKKRAIKLELDALEFFPIFLLSLKGGRNIKKALILSVDVVDNDLSIEFMRVLHDVKIGKSLDEALTLMKDRIPSIIVTNILINIIEANRLGNSVDFSINSQLEYIEEDRNRKIISYYKSIPLKIAVISVIFVFMVIALLLLCQI